MSSLHLTQIPESQFIPSTHPHLESAPLMFTQEGRLAATSQHVHLVAWTVPVLVVSCYDGMTFKSHVMDEVKLHMLLSQSRYAGTLSTKLSGSALFPIAPLLGMIEKRTNVGVELQLIYHNQKEYVRLSDVIKTMGGLVKIPSLVLSGQIVHIVKLWIQQITEIQLEL